jgi:inosine-uridine nucleoside N-ribohydrolase
MNRLGIESRGYQSYCSLIDSVAVAALIDPSLVQTESVYCDVEVEGELTRGMTVVDRRMHHQWTSLPKINIASSVDYERFLDLVIAELCA